MSKISAIIITLNESKKIEDCLSSLNGFCDEIIIVDSGSIDNTLNICKRYTDKIFSTDWPGFGAQKNRALGHVSNEWVLSVDADEIISPDLQEEIINILNNPTYNSYKMPRLSTYCGRFLYNGGWWPDYVTRLFKKSSYTFTNDKIHERVNTRSDEVGVMKNHITHYRDDSLSDTLNRMNKYSTIWANENINKKKSGILKGITHSIWTFIRIYFIRRGFLDGKEGFLMAVSNSCGSFYKYVKLYYLQKGK